MIENQQDVLFANVSYNQKKLTSFLKIDTKLIKNVGDYKVNLKLSNI